MTGSEIAIGALGFAAGAATVAAQTMRTMIPLRAMAIVANLLFAAYGFLAQVWPSLVLALVLLPLNVMRLVGMRRLISQVRQTAMGGFDDVWLRPFTRRQHFRAGTLLFRRGDVADVAYYLLSGELLYPETGRKVGRGHFVGDMGLFAADHRRTNSGSCVADMEVLVIGYDQMLQLYLQNPRFGFYLV